MSRVVGVQVVLDTNPLENDRYAKRPLAEAAWRGAAAGDFRIVVPEAVIGELVKHFPEALEETLGELDATLKKKRRELGTFGLEAPEMPSVDVNALVDQYETDLRERCSEEGCRISPTPDLGPALEWAIRRRKPFDSNGHGLPDAAIWLTVLELAETDDVILVTNNSKDFGRPGQLRPELRGDLLARRIPEDRVRIVADLYELRREVVEPAAEATARVNRLLDDPSTGTELTAHLVDSLRQASIPSATRQLDFDLEDAPLLSDFEPDNFVVLNADQLDEDGILARLRTRSDVSLEVVVGRSEYFEAERAGVSLDTFDPDAYVYFGEVWIAADVTIDAIIRLDGTVEEAVIAEFARLPRDQEFQRRLDSDLGERLIEALDAGTTPPGIAAYRPPEPVAGAVESATVEGWDPGGWVELEELLERDPDDGLLVALLVHRSASIRWLVSAPYAEDLARFGSLAEGVEDGGGFLHDVADVEQVVLHLTARLTHDGWDELDVTEVTLDPDVLSHRVAEAEDEGSDETAEPG